MGDMFQEVYDRLMNNEFDLADLDNLTEQDYLDMVDYIIQVSFSYLSLCIKSKIYCFGQHFQKCS